MSKAFNSTSTIVYCDICERPLANKKSLSSHKNRMHPAAHEFVQTVQKTERPVLNIGKPQIPVEEYDKLKVKYTELVDEHKDLYKKHNSTCTEVVQQCVEITRQNQIISDQVQVITEQGKMIRELRKSPTQEQLILDINNWKKTVEQMTTAIKIANQVKASLREQIEDLKNQLDDQSARKKMKITGTPENPFPLPSTVNSTPLPKFFSPSQLFNTPDS